MPVYLSLISKRKSPLSVDRLRSHAWRYSNYISMKQLAVVDFGCVNCFTGCSKDLMFRRSPIQYSIYVAFATDPTDP